MKIGIIGYGSIGKRHVNNLISLGFEDISLLREISSGNEHKLKEYSNLQEFLDNNFDFIIVSNPTSFHYKYLETLINLNINVLVEKPIVDSYIEINKLNLLLKSYNGIGMVAYNTRFHPCIKKIESILNQNVIGTPLYARFYIGQYLPDWRPSTDYRKSVSAKKELGGGVASELIHELDLAIHLFGDPASIVKSMICKLSDLEIETEDSADFMYISSNNVAINIHTDYFYRGYKRDFEIIGNKGTIMCNLYNANILVANASNEIIINECIENFNRNDMYFEMLKYYINCVRQKITPKPSFNEGLVSISIVENAKNN